MLPCERVRAAPLKYFDRFLTPAACGLARLLPKPTRRAYTPMIVRPGGLGDLICADMALQAMGRDARDFFWLIEGRSQPWTEYRSLPHLCYDRESMRTMGTVLGRFALVINSEQSFGLSQAYGLLARSSTGRLVSFDTNRGASWADLTVPYDWKDAHEVHEFARLFSAALGDGKADIGNFARPRLKPVSAPPLVLIAGRQSRSRALPLETWEMLMAKWHGDRKFLVAASPEDIAFANRLVGKFEGRASRFVGSFVEMCDQIARAEELFTMDGGGAHIGSYFGVPTFAIFTSGRDHKWAPISARSRVLRRHDLPCQPCTKFGQVPPCPNQYACQKLEDVDSTLPR